MTYSPFPPVYTTPGGAAPADVLAVAGSDGTDARTLSTDTSGRQLIQHPNNALLATTAESVTSTVTTLSETASVNGQCVVVSVSCVAAKTMAFPVAVRVRDTSNGITTAWQLCPVQVAGGNACQLYFNLPVTNGDTVDIDLIAQGTVGSGATNVAVVLSPFSIPTALRPDGRSLPLISQYVDVNATAPTTATVVSAVAGWRVLAAFIYIAAVASGSCSLAGVLNGATAYLGFVTGASWVQVPLPPAGILLDANTAVSYTPPGSGTGGSVFGYDLVPI